MSTISISFVIPAYNEAGSLPSTLASIKESIKACGVAAEIIVVDNNSSDGSAGIALESGADRVVFEPVNSIARARNAGARAASAPLLVFIDADTKLSTALLKDLLERMAAGGVCGGGARLSFDAPMCVMANFATVLWNFSAPLFGLAAGSFCFCLKEAFEDLGGFDETFYAAEDLALSKELKRWGRSRGMRFAVLKTPALTSARRITGKGSWFIISKMLPLLLMPWRLRSKTHCAHWYDHTTRGES
jgi:glycosyltransferase involved in cell wall biosynthesis